MVFATLTQRDKEAFFALLDEYFESRPGLLGGSENGILQPISATNTGNASLRAATNTPPRPPARSLSSTRSVPPPPGGGGPPAVPSRTKTPQIVEPTPTAPDRGEDEDEDEAPVSVSSRIKAAQANIGNAYASAGRPPVPAQRRVSSQSSTSPTTPVAPPRSPAPPVRTVVSPPRPSSGNSTPSGLQTSQGIGSINTSSGGAAVGSVFSFKGVGKNGNKSHPIVSTPAAFEKPRTRDSFAPPPRRGNGAGTSPAPQVQASLPAEEEEEEEAQGEWVQALYDLEAAEATDLSFKAGDQIWVTERTSKDWWMAEIDGKAGLVPATYVKPL